MDHAEEQEMEVEALQSIYDEDFIGKSPTAFTIIIQPTDFDSEDGEVHVGLKLHVTYPPTYPEVVPTILIENIKGLNTKTVSMLAEKARAAAADNVGDVMIYDIADMLKEWLEANNHKEKSLHDQMLDSMEKKKAEEGLNDAKIVSTDEEKDAWVSPHNVEKGTLTTKESFAAWNEKFMNAYAEKEAEEKKKRDAKQLEIGRNRLTGREIFALKKTTRDEDGTEEKSAEKGEEELDDVFCYNEDLYGDEDDEEFLPSDDDEDVA